MLTRYPGARGGAALGARCEARNWLAIGIPYGTSLSFIITPLTHSSYRIGYLFSEKVFLRVKFTSEEKLHTHPTPRRPGSGGAARGARATADGPRRIPGPRNPAPAGEQYTVHTVEYLACSRVERVACVRRRWHWLHAHSPTSIFKCGVKFSTHISRVKIKLLMVAARGRWSYVNVYVRPRCSADTQQNRAGSIRPPCRCLPHQRPVRCRLLHRRSLRRRFRSWPPTPWPPPPRPRRAPPPGSG